MTKHSALKLRRMDAIWVLDRDRTWAEDTVASVDQVVETGDVLVETSRNGWVLCDRVEWRPGVERPAEPAPLPPEAEPEYPPGIVGPVTQIVASVIEPEPFQGEGGESGGGGASATWESPRSEGGAVTSSETSSTTTDTSSETT